MKKLILILFVLVNTMFANELLFNSGEKKVNIIELYTSQGCSSCPVAEDWVNGLKKRSGLFTEFIPLAFHVTYWDFIGWKDIFGNKNNDIRQRDYANKVWKKNSVYTPQFVINSKEYRRWFSNQSFPRFDDTYGGNLKLKINNQNLDISFNSKEIKDEELFVNVVILGFDYSTDVTSGENEDRDLPGDFVVLKHQRHLLKSNENNLAFNTTLPKYKKDGHQKAVVVWLNKTDGTIVQATGGYLTK
ncbi:MAG: DUF1223 domain-containing protein [Campylobacteraceae bacterium]|nr:DUF1223 domain-containing protein [Campylobacteraceae bacterium]